jgi:hypothetical protein
MNKINNFFLGGDGASWVKTGISYLEKPEFYLDKFHLMKALKKAFSFKREKVTQALKAIETSRFDELLLLLKKEEKVNPEKAKEIKKVARYLTNNKDYLLKEKEIVGLGAAEGNIDKILANRFKKRGMSWTIDGAHNMAKMIEVRLSEPMDKLLYSYMPKLDEKFKNIISEVKLKVKVKEDPGSWLKVAIPAFDGPHASRPWVKTLKEIVYS